MTGVWWSRGLRQLGEREESKRGKDVENTCARRDCCTTPSFFFFFFSFFFIFFFLLLSPTITRHPTSHYANMPCITSAIICWFPFIHFLFVMFYILFFSLCCWSTDADASPKVTSLSPTWNTLNTGLTTGAVSQVSFCATARCCLKTSAFLEFVSEHSCVVVRLKQMITLYVCHANLFTADMR